MACFSWQDAHIVYMRQLLITIGGHWLVGMYFCLASTVATADVARAQRQEIEHLLMFVADSGCQVSRNGSVHSASEAVAHIRKKYDYFRDDIVTTEDFIRLSATKSTLSGRHYTVQCPGEESLNTQLWLLQELARFRHQNPARLDGGAD